MILTLRRANTHHLSTELTFSRPRPPRFFNLPILLHQTCDPYNFLYHGQDVRRATAPWSKECLLAVSCPRSMMTFVMLHPNLVASWYHHILTNELTLDAKKLLTTYSGIPLEDLETHIYSIVCCCLTFYPRARLTMLCREIKPGESSHGLVLVNFGFLASAWRSTLYTEI